MQAWESARCRSWRGEAWRAIDEVKNAGFPECGLYEPLHRSRPTPAVQGVFAQSAGGRCEEPGVAVN